MTYICHYSSPLGEITLASSGSALTGLWFEGQKYFGSTLTKECEEKSLEVFDETKRWLDIYFSGREPDFVPPLKMDTTTFRRAVWEEMLRIPYGQTTTYGHIAKEISAMDKAGARAAQAVGNAVAHNPILLIVPCHRVLGHDGSLTGYAGGTDKKAKLLELEGIDI